MREFNTKFSLSHTNLFKLVTLISVLFFHSQQIVLLAPHVLSLLIVLLILLVSEFQTSFSHRAPVLWNNLPPDLRQFSQHLTSSTSSLNSPVSDLSLSLFLKKAQNSSFSLFFSSVVFIHLGFLWTDISGTEIGRAHV